MKKETSKFSPEQNRKALSLIQFATKAGKAVKGMDNVIRQIELNKVRLVVVAEDMAFHGKKRITAIADDFHIALVEWGKKSDSLSFSDREVGIIGITDKNFAVGIINCLSHQEVEE